MSTPALKGQVKVEGSQARRGSPQSGHGEKAWQRGLLASITFSREQQQEAWATLPPDVGFLAFRLPGLRPRGLRKDSESAGSPV